MAHVIPIDEEAAIEPAPLVSAPLKLSWGAIFGAMFVALGLWLMLLTLGLAVGLTVVNPDSPSAVRIGASITGLWSVIALLASLFVGGMIASRAAGWVDRTTGAIHGAVLWGFTTLAGATVLSLAMTAGAGTALRLGAGIAGAAATAMSATAGEGTLEDRGTALGPMLGVDSDDLLAPLNRRLRMEGKPPVTRGQLEAAARDMVERARREGRLDHEQLVASIARNTELSPMDADQLADQIEARVEQQRARMETSRRDEQHATSRIADATAEAMWWSFIGLALSLMAALAGATIGVGGRRRYVPTIEPAPLATTREAHP
ncbi:MAG: hypothetical protein KF819_32990 [Labilithrix sp.]|nr:hypothetical protein [Labilithrix sp.]